MAVDIAAPPGRVWATLIDVERWCEWMPLVTGARMPGKLAVGARVTIDLPRFPPTTWKVTELVPGMRFTRVGGVPGIRVTAGESVEPSGNGTRVKLSLHFEGFLLRFLGDKIDRIGPQYLSREAAGLKWCCEQGPRPPDVAPEKWRVGAMRSFNRLSRRTKEQNLRVLAARGETVEGFTIRDATEADIPELANLHVITWNDCYQATGPSVAIREWQWRKQFAEQDGSWFVLLVVRANGELIGFAKGKRTDNPQFTAELNKIYLLPEYQRVGIGTRLTKLVVERFLAMGLNSMWLYAEADNPSGDFYEALGGYNRPNDDGTMNYGNYFWDDLTVLARRLDKASADPSLRSG